MDCRGCAQRAPRLLKANVKALELWGYVVTQWRTGVNGPTGLDYNAVYRVARTLGIRMDRAMLQKLCHLEGDFLQEMDERRERDAMKARRDESETRRTN